MNTSIGWAVSPKPVGYLDAVAVMEARAAAIAEGRAGELVWLLEHPPLYTAGTSARAGDLLQPDRFPVFRSGRGGQYTYHGPGQRVVYVMLDLRKHGCDVKAFVAGLESWTIAALAQIGIRGETRCGRVGVWVARPDCETGAEDKIAALGIRLRRWVSFHGIAINVAPDLSHFDGIVPCGIAGHGVTSLAAIARRDGVPPSATATPTEAAELMQRLDTTLRTSFEAQFGATADEASPICG